LPLLHPPAWVAARIFKTRAESVETVHVEITQAGTGDATQLGNKIPNKVKKAVNSAW
jgi:hypothetical protein